MDIGKERPAITVEPLEDPFEVRDVPEPAPDPVAVPEPDTFEVPVSGLYDIEAS